MRILVACEFSGIVRDAFRARGHDAISCDLEPSERPGPHVVGDVRPLLRQKWDLVIAHPPCTYLCNSGVRWLYERPSRWESLRAGAAFFRECLAANAPLVAVENPTMHKYAIDLVGEKPAFCIQPWQFGHPETKRTCFWSRGMPPLLPTQIVRERSNCLHKLPRTPDRGKLRSTTFTGIAEAMADQWGNL